MHVQHLDNVSFISSNKLLSRVGSLHFPSMDTEFSPFKRKDEPLVEVWFWSYPHCCPPPPGHRFPLPNEMGIPQIPFLSGPISEHYDTLTFFTSRQT